MNGTVTALRNAPIVEAVLDIDCDLPPGSTLEALQQQAKSLFEDRYPKVQLRFGPTLQVELNEGGPVAQSTQQGLQALQFFTEDGAQLVQVREGGYSFNRLRPYTSFDDYLPEIHRTWTLYLALVRPVLVRQIQLRYINRILLPLGDGKLALDEYFKVGPRLPDEHNLSLVGFLNQYVAVESETGHQVATVLTAQPPEAGFLPVIFDNAVTATCNEEPGDWDALRSRLLSLRELKNRVFRNTLEEKCLNLFR